MLNDEATRGAFKKKCLHGSSPGPSPTLFQRLYDVFLTLWTSHRRRNDVSVCTWVACFDLGSSHQTSWLDTQERDTQERDDPRLTILLSMVGFKGHINFRSHQPHIICIATVRSEAIF